jgi:hypothetical protein
VSASKVTECPWFSKAHRSRETQRFLDSKPDRFELVVTPTHASWLNQVEMLFSKTAWSVLRRIRVAGKEELTQRVQHYIGFRNEAPLMPKWVLWHQP